MRHDYRHTITPAQQAIAQLVCEIGYKHQQLIRGCIDSGNVASAKQLQQIDRQLWQVFRCKKSAFDFVGAIASGTTLLVGEGNLSFASSLVGKTRIVAQRVTASTYESTENLSDEVAENASKISARGVSVQHGVDATELHRTFGSRRFDNIVFQFPHTGSREPVGGHNPNFVLVRDFLKSAKRHLHPGGKVLVTVVDSPHYQGAFQLEEAGGLAGFQKIETHRFDPTDFPGYTHTMTHEEGSALDEHDCFATWVFSS